MLEYTIVLNFGFLHKIFLRMVSVPQKFFPRNRHHTAIISTQRNLSLTWIIHLPECSEGNTTLPTHLRWNAVIARKFFAKLRILTFLHPLSPSPSTYRVLSTTCPQDIVERTQTRFSSTVPAIILFNERSNSTRGTNAKRCSVDSQGLYTDLLMYPLTRQRRWLAGILSEMPSKKWFYVMVLRCSIRYTSDCSATRAKRSKNYKLAEARYICYFDIR